MFQINTNTNALSGNSLSGVNKWDSKSLEIFATKKKSTQCGLRFKMTLLSSGDLEIGASGVDGSRFSETSFYDGGWE